MNTIKKNDKKQNKTFKDINNDKVELINIHKKNLTICICVFSLATVASFFFKNLASDPSINIAMLYTVGVFIITRYTEGYLYGMLFSIASVVAVNFFFTYPYQDLNFTIQGYQVTFAGMFIIAIITSAMSSNMKQQQRKLQEQEKALMEAQKEKMRVNLLRAVSHDLRTPLTGIIGNSASYLEMGDVLNDEEKKQLVENIEGDANWLLNMVENLLSVTRIDNETAKVNKVLESVDEVVSAAAVRFRKHYPDVKLKITLSDDVIMVMMDPMLIQQVIINLLQNAHIHGQGKEPIELKIEDEESYIRFRVIDYGLGIDETKLNTIFDGDGSMQEKSQTDGYKGMGIGLSICKTIILAHNGKIKAENHQHGAEFSFLLPKEEPYESEN